MGRTIKYLLRVLNNPKHIFSTFKFYFKPETLLKPSKKEGLSKRLYHVAAFTPHNAGDALQTILVRDILGFNGMKINWKLKHVHTKVTDEDVQKINKRDAVLIGSGGLILPKFENISGWQWNCDINTLHEIKTPIIGFGLGYNLFKGHDISSALFLNHINTVLEKSIFFGMRNTGSVKGLSALVEDKHKEKIVFQPCITTMLTKIYPELIDNKPKKNVIALNCAFDREGKRFGNKKDQILNAIAIAMRKLSATYEIHYFANAASDEQMLPYLDSTQVDYKLVKLYDVSPKIILSHYSYPKIVLGMRGHAQLIPFGCGTPILSLVSHDKLQFFLDDIKAPEWGVDVFDDNLEDKIVEKTEAIINDETTMEKIESEKQKLWDITLKNVNEITTTINSL